MHLTQIDPADLLIFARVVAEKSFSRAAEVLRLPKATVSRRVAALESALGEQLLLRTTRRLSVTDFGRGVLEHADRIGEEVEAAIEFAASRRARPTGRLRVTMPGDFAMFVLVPLLARFARDEPGVTLEIDLTSRFVDLIGENYDVAIRMGALRDDASLAARRFASLTSSLFASPDYVARRGLPSEPEALMEHDAVMILGRTGEPLPWVLSRGSERWEGRPPARATANSPELLMRMAAAGAGVAIANDRFAAAWVARGELVPVLAEWKPPAVDAWAVFPGRRLMPSRTRAFLDALGTLGTLDAAGGLERPGTGPGEITRARPVRSGARRARRD
ncbi:MAG TPA: LysR family transcriptional regulator [Casimicrobiaceae bacterium]|nr:LysR family transcriptional regulator [Casimicrobiaceae bacterium]